jgi:endonuclease YncB( thermonuclease family)
MTWCSALLLAVQVTTCPLPATLERVIDGDSYVLRVELGFDTIARVAIRLEGLDTPERFTEEGRRAAAAALARLHAGRITIVPTGARTFARWVAHVYVDGESLAARLRADGHAKGAP